MEVIRCGRLVRIIRDRKVFELRGLVLVALKDGRVRSDVLWWKRVKCEDEAIALVQKG